MDIVPFLTGVYDTSGTSGLLVPAQIDTMLEYLNERVVSIPITDKLIDWSTEKPEEYTATNVIRNDDDAIVSANILWPDGSTGIFVTDSFSTAFPGAIDAYHITYVPTVGTTRTITQDIVTRDGDGKVIYKPSLVVS